MLIFLLSISAMLSFADTPSQRLENLVDTLSTTPASLNGHISVGKRVQISRTAVTSGLIKTSAAVEWREFQSIGFGITENELSLNTEGALVIKYLGFTVGIKSIRYNKQGKFEVDLKLALIDKGIEQKIGKALEEKFKDKMILAFQELSNVRRDKGRNAGAVVERVMNIFKDPSATTSPFENVPMRGNVALNFQFEEARSLQVSDKYVADIQANDTISAGADFTRSGNRLNFSEIQFNSYKGVTFRPEKGSHLSLNSLRVTQVTISDRGIEPVMVSGAEETLTGVGQLVALITAAGGVSSMGNAADCDPRITEIQNYLQKQLNGQLVPLIRQHKTALLRAGIDPHVLEALEG